MSRSGDPGFKEEGLPVEAQYLTALVRLISVVMGSFTHSTSSLRHCNSGPFQGLTSSCMIGMS
jgi:hypothetical protein